MDQKYSLNSIMECKIAIITGLLFELFIWSYNIFTTINIEASSSTSTGIGLLRTIILIFGTGIIVINIQYCYIMKVLLDKDEKVYVKKCRAYVNLCVLNFYLTIQILRSLLAYNRALHFDRTWGTFFAGFNSFFDQCCMFLGPVVVSGLLMKYLRQSSFVVKSSINQKIFLKAFFMNVVRQS